MKLMLLMTIKTARLQPPGGMRNDSWRVPIGFLTPSDYKGVRNRPWICTYICGELQVAATASKGVILGKVSFLVSRLLESGKKGP